MGTALMEFRQMQEQYDVDKWSKDVNHSLLAFVGSVLSSSRSDTVLDLLTGVQGYLDALPDGGMWDYSDQAVKAVHRLGKAIYLERKKLQGKGPVAAVPMFISADAEKAVRKAAGEAIDGRNGPAVAYESFFLALADVFDALGMSHVADLCKHTGSIVYDEMD